MLLLFIIQRIWGTKLFHSVWMKNWTMFSLPFAVCSFNTILQCVCLHAFYSSCQTKVMPFTTTFLHSIFSLFFPLCFQGLCFECGSDGKQCAKVGYSAIDYKSLSAKRKQTNLKFFFNTGRTKPFCRKSPNKCSALIISAHRFFSLLQNITI